MYSNLSDNEKEGLKETLVLFFNIFMEESGKTYEDIFTKEELERLSLVRDSKYFNGCKEPEINSLGNQNLQNIEIKNDSVKDFVFDDGNFALFVDVTIIKTKIKTKVEPKGLIILTKGREINEKKFNG